MDLVCHAVLLYNIRYNCSMILCRNHTKIQIYNRTDVYQMFFYTFFQDILETHLQSQETLSTDKYRKTARRPLNLCDFLGRCCGCGCDFGYGNDGSFCVRVYVLPHSYKYLHLRFHFLVHSGV